MIQSFKAYLSKLLPLSPNRAQIKFVSHLRSEGKHRSFSREPLYIIYAKNPDFHEIFLFFF